MLITNFSCGELSPTLSGRQDLQQYYAGAARIENYDVIPTGGIRRRCGTKRMGELSGVCRLIPFILDKDTSFIFEFIPGKILIWKNGEKLMNGSSQVSISTEYQSMYEIREIQYVQNYDTMVFTQRNHPPFMIKYSFAATSFSSSAMSFDFTPDVELDDNYAFVKIVTDASLPLTASDGDYCLFKGKLYTWTTSWQQVGTDPDIDTDLFSTAGKYPGCCAFFNNRLWFASTLTERQKVWASAAPDTKGNRYNEFPTYKKYVTVEKVVKESNLHLFSGTVKKGEKTITGVTQDLTGISDITGFYCSGDSMLVGTKVVSATWDSSSNTGTLTVSNAATADGSNVEFTIQSWKYPTAATSDDYTYKVENHDMTTSDLSFFFELASDQNDSVKWMTQNSQLIIGTESSEWIIPSSITALSVSAQLNSRHGSDDIQATCVDNAVVFFGQGKKSVREYYWNSDAGAFRSNNIAMLSLSMIEESDIIDFDYMTNPYCRLLAVRADGTMACMLYEKSMNVTAWYRFTCAGEITSCAVTRGESSCDYVYLAVKHGSSYILERYDENDGVYLDSWKPYSQESAASYQSNAIIFDATQKKEIAIADAAQVNAGDEAYIGYKYSSVITSMPISGSDPTGKKRITSLVIRFCNAWMPVMVCSNSTEQFTGVSEPYTGVKEITYPGTSDIDVSFTITASQCRPCTILAVNAQLAQ